MSMGVSQNAHVLEGVWQGDEHRGSLHLIGVVIGRCFLTGTEHGVGARGWREKGRLNLRSYSVASFSTPSHSYLNLLLRVATQA